MSRNCRLTMEVTPKLWTRLSKMCTPEGIDYFCLIRRALAVYEALLAEERAGNVLVSKRPDGTEKRVLLRPDDVAHDAAAES